MKKIALTLLLLASSAQAVDYKEYERCNRVRELVEVIVDLKSKGFSRETAKAIQPTDTSLTILVNYVYNLHPVMSKEQLAAQALKVCLEN